MVFQLGFIPISFNKVYKRWAIKWQKLYFFNLSVWDDVYPLNRCEPIVISNEYPLYALTNISKIEIVPKSPPIYAKV